jgi:hypothetical protein
MKKQNELRRSFGGKTENFESKDEENNEKKHLKAYLKGYKMYRDGYRTIGNYEDGTAFRTPSWFDVKEIWS